MKWSKLKKTIEDKFADCLSGRVSLYATRYTSGSYFMVRGWITADKIEIANFSTPDNNSKFEWNTPEIDEAIISDNPIIRAFAMLDRRLGKRRLRQIDKTDLHPLVLRLLNLRLECENIKYSKEESKEL